MTCALCGSTEDVLNFHHLIPVSLHSKAWYKERYDKSYLKTWGIWICRDYCHPQIHKFITEKEMGRVYNTKELLMTHPEVKKYVEWRSRRVK